MASFVYESVGIDEANAVFNFGTGSFKAMLLTAAYTPNQTGHTRRSDLTGEASGTGYTAGGIAVTVVEAKNVGTKQVTLTFSSPTWPSSTISAEYLAVYQALGGAATADPLVCLLDNGSVVASSNGPFTFTISGPIAEQF